MVVLLAAPLGAVIGLVVGALGGGGGVLTVPVLVYLLGQSGQDATTGSVIIVGLTALAGAAARARDGSIDWRTAVAFGVIGGPAAVLGTALNRDVDQSVLLLAFAAVTVLAAGAMLVDTRRHAGEPRQAVAVRTRVSAKAVAVAAPIGFLTGFLGVGGGFLVVPALVIVLQMPMPTAIGTSLLVIGLNALTSFGARVGDLHVDWAVIAPFTITAVIACLAGKRLTERLPGHTLSTAFAVLLVLVGVFTGAQSLLSL
ncbi:sulfite exporter TauE/SafE family protein [Actinokineospora sp. UTMC 2448]|uniref:sulfite exporter TauE/SafE family protein n=1 Tax=Actinokineospora sp. UTMC 2448 TaxID=2268449 RepID=UPI00216408F6|nr:sulfite exporter TauE/SafE family protein [Actinokineospora sp. UTMC 2448]UVS80239.1 Sulfite exporter TauE/SafE [Actinokineospora sp. UTMC 2448]